MNEEQAIVQALNAVMRTIDSIGLQNISPEVKTQLTQLITSATNRIQSLRQEAGINFEDVDMLWLLAGGNEEAFLEYLKNFPMGNTAQLLKNPKKLQQVIKQLKERFGQGIQLQQDGIPHAPLMSSNVYGFKYDNATGNLLVRFNEGGVYSYSGVPKNVFNLFAAGAIPAKTDGENRWGRWWKNKSPSLGSSLNVLLKLGGFPYQKLA